MLFLARWVRRLSWKETAAAFRASWDKVFDAVERIVAFRAGAPGGQAKSITISVDEIQYAKEVRLSRSWRGR